MDTTTKTLTLNEAVGHVRAFHDAFGIPNANAPMPISVTAMRCCATS